METTRALETDVVVIGAGNAASVAALAAHDLGAKVLLLERAPKERRGGNSAFSGGLFRFAFTDFEQIKSIVRETAGVEFKDVDVEPYPTDRFYGDLMRVTEGLADPVLSEMLVERSQEVVTWMAQARHRLGTAHEPCRQGQREAISGAPERFPSPPAGAARDCRRCISNMWKAAAIEVIYSAPALWSCRRIKAARSMAY